MDENRRYEFAYMTDLFKIQLTWKTDPPFQKRRRMRLAPEDRAFAAEVVKRWIQLGFARKASRKKSQMILYTGQI